VTDKQDTAIAWQNTSSTNLKTLPESHIAAMCDAHRHETKDSQSHRWKP